MQIDFPKPLFEKIKLACSKANLNEIGGMLFGEHLGPGHFRIAELTIDEAGLVATFKRSIQHVLNSCKQFFKKTNHDYRRFNYLGEWHSHPQFKVFPSSTDNQSMLEIVCDKSVGANFAVLLIVRLDKEKLNIGGWAYFPDGTRIDAHVDVV